MQQPSVNTSTISAVLSLCDSLEACQFNRLNRSIAELTKDGFSTQQSAKRLGSRLVQVFLECVETLDINDKTIMTEQQPQKKRLKPSLPTSKSMLLSASTTFTDMAPRHSRSASSSHAHVLSCIVHAVNALECLSRIGISSEGGQKHLVQTLWSNKSGLDPIKAARRVRKYESSYPSGTYKATMAIFNWFHASLRLIDSKRSVIDLREKFQGFDEDNSGGITRDEFLAKLRAPPYSMRLSAAAVRELVSRFDTDGDDQVDFSEFVAFFFDQKDSMESSKSDLSKGLSTNDLRQVNSVENELREFFDLFTGRGKRNALSERRTVQSVVEFAMETFVSHAGWRYSSRADRWMIARLCLDTMCLILTHDSTSLPVSRRAEGRIEEDARDILLEALLEDRGMQRSLLNIATMLASTSFVPIYDSGSQMAVNGSDPYFGRKSAVSGGLLPVDFGKGLHKPGALPLEELEGIECMVCRAFDLLVLILEEPVNSIGSNSSANSASDRMQYAQSKYNLIAFDLAIPQHNLTSIDSSASEIKANAVVAISALVKYGQFAKTREGQKLPELALRLLELICPIVAMSAISSRQKASLSGGMSQRLTVNQFREVHPLSGMDTMPGGGLALENQTSFTSLLGFFSKPDHDRFRDMLKQELQLSGDRNSSRRRCAILRFVGAACEHQPTLGNLLLSDMVSNTGIFENTGTSAESMAVVSSAFALLVEIWDQGRAKRDAFLARIGNKEQRCKFWGKVLRPLTDIVESQSHISQQPTHSQQNRRWEPSHSYNLEICAFALQLLAYEMTVPNSMSREILDAAVQKRGMIDCWFQEFCRFDYDSALVSRTTRCALENGVDLLLFVHLPVPSPGRRNYGSDYLYSVTRMQSVLAPKTCIEQNRNHVETLLKDVGSLNLMSGAADAQLFVLRAWKAFVEMYCIAPSAPVIETAASSPPILKSSPSITREDGVSAFVGDMTSRRILSQENIQVVSDLVKQHTESRGNGAAMVSAIQEMAGLIASMLHHRIFEPGSGKETSNNNFGSEDNKIWSDSTLKAAGAATSVEILRRQSSGLNLAQHADLIRGFRIWCGSCFTGEGKDGLNTDLAQPLFAGALLTLLDLKADTISDLDSAREEFRRSLEKDIDLLAEHAARCVRILGKMLTGTSENEVNIRAKRPDLEVSAHIILDKSIALLSNVLSRKNGGGSLYGNGPSFGSTMGMDLSNNGTIQMALGVLWPLLGRTPEDFDINFASGKSAIAILHFLKEISQPQQVLLSNYGGKTFTRHLDSHDFSQMQSLQSHLQPCANILVELDVITQLSGSLALRGMQEQISRSASQKERGYINMNTRRQLHDVWCLVLSLVTVIVRHSGKGSARHPLSKRAFEQALDFIAVHEKTFLSILKLKYGWTRATLCEAEAIAGVVTALTSQNAQRWRLARPEQFQRFMRGMLSCCSSMSRLVRHNVRESLEGYTKLRTYTHAVSLSEQHEQIVSMKQVTIPTRWDEDRLLDKYHFSYDKGRRVKDACHRLAMEISQDARVEHVGIFLLQRRHRTDLSACVDGVPQNNFMELISMTTNRPFHFNKKIAVDSSTLPGYIVQENLKLFSNSGKIVPRQQSGNHGICGCYPDMNHPALNSNSIKTVSASVAQSMDDSSLTTRTAFCAPIFERRVLSSGGKRDLPESNGTKNFGPLLGVILVANHQKAKSGTTLPASFLEDQLSHVLDKARKLGTTTYLCIEVEDWIDVHLGNSEAASTKISASKSASPRQSNPSEAQSVNPSAVCGEVIQVITSPYNASDVYFRVRFEASFFNTIQQDASCVLNQVLPLLCNPSVSPYDARVPRGLVEGNAGIGVQDYQGIVAFTHLDDVDSNSKVSGSFTPLTSMHLLVVAQYAFGDLSMIGDESENFWFERRSMRYRRAVRLLEMSLFLFWNHTQRYASIMAMRGFELEANVLSKLRLMLQGIGIFGHASHGRGRGRSVESARGSNSNALVGGSASPRYKPRSPTIGGNQSPRRFSHSSSPKSPQSPSWYRLGYDDDFMTFELELERIFFLNDKAALEEEVEAARAENSSKLLLKEKELVLQEGQSHLDFLRAFAEKIRNLVF